MRNRYSRTFTCGVLAATLLCAAYLPLPSALAVDNSQDNLVARVHSLLWQKKFKETNVLLKSLLPTAANNRIALFKIYACYADLASSEHKPQEMLKWMQLAEPLAKTLGEKSYQAKVLELKSDYYGNHLKDYRKTIPYDEALLTELKTLLSPGDPRLSKYEERLIWSYEKTGQTAKAQQLKTVSDKRNQTFAYDTQSSIQIKWSPPNNSEKFQATYAFKYGMDGKAHDLKQLKSSGSEKYDRHCVNTLMRMQLPPFKDWEFETDPIDIEFTFSYNMSTGNLAARAREDFSEYRIKRNRENRAQEVERLEKAFASITDDATMSKQATVAIQFKLFQAMISLNHLDNAKQLVSKQKAKDGLSPLALLSIKAQSGIILEREKKNAEAELLLKEAVDSQEFQSLQDTEMKKTVLKAYGDVLYKQGKTDEASKIYEKLKAQN